MRLFILLSLLFAHAASAQEIFVKEIQAKMYLSYSGGLSAPIKESDTLWNTLIGEGSAEEPSTSTLVDVLITGKPESYPKGAIVVLEVRNQKSRKLLSRQEHRVGTLSPDGYYHAGFWLADTGCDPLLLVVYRKNSKLSVQKTLPFACGE